MGILGAIFIVMFFGPLTSAKCAIGYALIDSIVGTRLDGAASWHRFDPLAAGFLAGLLFLVASIFPRSVTQALQQFC
jgi:hypothetical protein